MQIVIDIDEELYKTIKKNGYIYEEEVENVALSVIGGTPLPKGHGRLIDESDLIPDSDYEDGMFYAYSIGVINDAPTIIEADTAESEVEG